MHLRIGTAGWSVPRTSAPQFPGQGTHLQRYAQVMPAAEINSSFYRPHAVATYTKWAMAVPENFRFSVKMPGAITHEQRLRQPAVIAPLLRRFVGEIGGLGPKLGPVLVQLPPSLEFNLGVARRFFGLVREHLDSQLVCEPRHQSWFSPRATDVLMQFEVARVAADPVRTPGADVPAAWPSVAYYRLHGSPRTYWSSYDDGRLEGLAATLRSSSPESDTWLIFDNTASGAALQNAWQLSRLLSS